MRAGAAALSVALLALVLQACTVQQPPVRIGVLLDCMGFARNSQDVVVAGALVPLLQRGAHLHGARPSDGVTAATVGGREVELVMGCYEGGGYSTLIEQARQLVEVEDVNVVVGGTLPGDGLVLRDVAKRYPRVAFVIAMNGPREVTLANTSANVFRFVADLSQQAAGLGTYAFRDLGWRHALVIAEDGEVGWAGAAAFLAEFCALGGRATQQPLPFFDRASYVPTPPTAPTDGVVVLATPVGLSPDWFTVFAAGAPPASAVLLGPLFTQVPDFTASLPDNLRGVGTVAPAADVGTRHKYAAAYAQSFPGPLATQAMQPYPVAYHDAVEAVMIALERSNGEVGADGAVLRRALGSVDANLLSGRVHLDGNGAPVVSTALVRLRGNGAQELIRTVPNIDQTFGGALPATYEPSSGEQPCRTGTPPPWAR